MGRTQGAGYPEEMTTQRLVLLVVGILLVAVGVLWTLQGVGIVGGSAMSGVTLWAIIGPVVAVAGGFCIFKARR